MAQSHITKHVNFIHEYFIHRYIKDDYNKLTNLENNKNLIGDQV